MALTVAAAADERLRKLRRDTLAIAATWTGEEDEEYCKALVYDGESLYAGLAAWPATITKIDPSTMLSISRWRAPADVNECHALAFDGLYVYFGFNTQPARVVRKIMRHVDEEDL